MHERLCNIAEAYKFALGSPGLYGGVAVREFGYFRLTKSRRCQPDGS